MADILRNSAIRIYKGVKMDRNYDHVLNPLTDQQILTAIADCLVATNSSYSFIRDTGTIQTAFSYNDILDCNYIAFQNPDYSNKWFFGWIDRIDYINDNNVSISYTLDLWTTWINLFNFNPVLVVREHVNNDAVGANVMPEPISADVVSPQYTMSKLFDSYNLVLNSTRSLEGEGNVIPVINSKYPNTAYTLCFDLTENDLTVAKSFIKNAITDGTIINILLYPTAYTGKRSGYYEAFDVVENTITDFPTPTGLHGYIPENNKLFTYPYSYILVDNCSNQMLLRYEEFSDFNQIRFVIRGFANPVGEITCLARNYDGLTANPYHSLTIRDFPMLPVAADAYLAWLAQKSNSTLLSGFTSAIGAAGAGFAAGGVPGAALGAIGGLFSGAANYTLQEQQAKDAADSVKGGNSSGVIDCATGAKGFYFKQMSLKYDQAVSIDNYFSQFGYAVNKVKIPNIYGRSFWNYVQVNGSAGYGNMPEEARTKINEILNKGVTIWHNHSYIGNYYISNNKMENPITA